MFRLALEQQPQLERLEASGCKGLRNVISNSTTLRSCYLQSCPRLAVRRRYPLTSYLVPSAEECGSLLVLRPLIDQLWGFAEREAADGHPEAPRHQQLRQPA